MGEKIIQLKKKKSIDFALFYKKDFGMPLSTNYPNNS